MSRSKRCFLLAREKRSLREILRSIECEIHKKYLPLRTDSRLLFRKHQDPALYRSFGSGQHEQQKHNPISMDRMRRSRFCWRSFRHSKPLRLHSCWYPSKKMGVFLLYRHPQNHTCEDSAKRCSIPYHFEDEYKSRSRVRRPRYR